VQLKICLILSPWACHDAMIKRMFLIILIEILNINQLLCFVFRYEGDKVHGLYDGTGIAYFIGGHCYEVFVSSFEFILLCLNKLLK